MVIPSQRLYFHMPVYRLLNGFDQYLSLNVNCEIYINSEFIDNHRPLDIRRIRSGFEKKGILKRIHGPFMDLCPGSSDKKVRALSRERILEALNLCADLGCSDIVLHSHYDPVYHKRHFDEWLNFSKMVWDDVSASAKKSNVTVYIENSEDDSLEPIIAILKEYPCFKACFDLAHYTIFGAESWMDALRRYSKDSIGEVHLSDNDGKEDQHLVLGEGSLQVELFLSAIDAYSDQPVITIEPHSDEDLLMDIEYMKRFKV